MSIRFEGASGRVVRFNLAGWRVVFQDARSLVLRPGWGCLVMRLMMTGIAALACFPLYQALTSVKHAEAAPLDSTQLALWLLICGIATIGVLAPLSVIWNRFGLGLNARDELEFSILYLWPKSKAWSPQDYARMVYGTRPATAYASKRYQRTTTWHWYVQLIPALTPDVGGASPPVEILVQSQKGPATPESPIPALVQAITGWLHAATNLPVEGPLYTAPGIYLGGRKVISRKVYHSLDDVPETVRAQVSAALADGQGQENVSVREVAPGVRVTNRMVINKAEYHSIDDVPENLRPFVSKALQEAKQELAGGQSLTPGSTLQSASHIEQTITIRDAQGNTRTYHSPDEMPPHVRALYEQTLPPRES